MTSAANKLFTVYGGVLLDPDAAAYITLIEGDGETVSDTQRAAIDTFYKTGKSEGWYSSLKRLYLPIWGAAAPNARCLVSGTSGTFSGTVTHAADHVKSDGATGYFDFGAAPSALGLTVASECVFAHVKTISTSKGVADYLIGSFENASKCLVLAGSWRGLINSTTGAGAILNTLGTDEDGTVILDREGGKRGIYLRRAAGLSTVVETTSADAGAVPDAVTLIAMGMNTTTTPLISRNDELGAYGAAAGLGTTYRSQFSAALRTLWLAATTVIVALAVVDGEGGTFSNGAGNTFQMA